MKALVFTGVHQPLSYQDVNPPTPTDGRVIVQVKAAALNHRDNWILKGMYRNVRAPAILGSDGVGEVDGRAVIINPNIKWGNNPRFPAPDYLILGLEEDGTFAEQISLRADKVVAKPAHLSIEEAAALSLGGMTAYRTLFTKCDLQAGEKVLISGVGGGVALFAFQFALAAGAEVYVTSSSDEKIQQAITMGAKGGANYRQKNWFKPLAKETGGFDVIIDSAGGDGFANLVRLCDYGARIGIYGGTRGLMNKISPQRIFFKQISILGSTMASDQEFVEMVEFVTRHQIVPVVDSIFPLAEGNAALERMNQGLQFGKIVLSMGR